MHGMPGLRTYPFIYLLQLSPRGVRVIARYINYPARGAIDARRLQCKRDIVALGSERRGKNEKRVFNSNDK